MKCMLLNKDQYVLTGTERQASIKGHISIRSLHFLVNI